MDSKEIVSAVVNKDLLDDSKLDWTLDPMTININNSDAEIFIDSGNWTSSNTYSLSQSTSTRKIQAQTLDLEGDGADININGKSLIQLFRDIEQRINILRPNPELESQWDQLRELGEAYRKLETELVEKQSMWKTLKKMPPADIP